MNECPVCHDPGGFHDHMKHQENQVPTELLLESGWQDEEHKEIVRRAREARKE